MEKEIESIIVSDENIIKNRQALLMYDITATGTSLKAGKYRIGRAGAKLVAFQKRVHIIPNAVYRFMISLHYYIF